MWVSRWTKAFFYQVVTTRQEMVTNLRKEMVTVGRQEILTRQEVLATKVPPRQEVVTAPRQVISKPSIRN